MNLMEAFPELEGAAPVWRGWYSSGEGEAPEYAARVGGGRAAGVPLARIMGIESPVGVIDGESESGLVQEHPEAGLMEHLAGVAAETENEYEADAFIGALIPLAAKVLPAIGRLVTRAAPRLIRSVGRIFRNIRRSRPARWMTRTIPTMLRRAGRWAWQRLRRGVRVNPGQVAANFRQQATTVLRRPHVCRRIAYGSRRLARAYRLEVRLVPIRY